MNLSQYKWAEKAGIDLLVESNASSAFIVQIRGFTENEQIIADHTTNSDRSRASSVVSITSAPIYLTARTSASNVKDGECFVRVSLRVEGVIVATLFSGYVTDSGIPAFPNGVIKSSLEGRGNIRSITGTNPAAGSEISETVPTNAYWLIHSFHYIFTADANVANRQLILQITDGATVIHRALGHPTATAGNQYRVSFGTMGMQTYSAGSASQGVLPVDILLKPGYVISTSTSSMQVGDDYGAPQLLVEEWISP